MFDVFLKSKFHSKCKSSIKLTKKRVEMIKRKRHAMEKFLKKDIIDLLKDGLDINAYGRAEGLLIELNMSACYDFVMQFCVTLYKQVPLMDKQRDCPEDCKEAVQSLMHAAARFADMPELRELRAIFLEKYGNSHEANINHEFVEKLKAQPPSKEMKIQLLQDIALESGTTWDSKALEQKLYVPPSSNHGLSEGMKDELVNKIKKETGNIRRGSSVPSSPKKPKDIPSYKTRKSNKDRYEPQGNENNPEIVIRKTELGENKPFQSKFAPPPPYHRRSSSEVKYELESNGKQEVQSKFAPPAHYIKPKTEEKAQEQDDDLGEKAKPKPKSVRSVRSKRAMVPPNDEKIVKNGASLDAIRQELALKPGHKSTNIDDDLRDINEVLSTKRESPRIGKGFRNRT